MSAAFIRDLAALTLQRLSRRTGIRPVCPPKTLAPLGGLTAVRLTERFFWPAADFRLWRQ